MYNSDKPLKIKFGKIVTTDKEVNNFVKNIESIEVLEELITFIIDSYRIHNKVQFCSIIKMLKNIIKVFNLLKKQSK